MRHPIEKYNQHQADVLSSLPDEQRDYMAQMFRIGNATYCYYNQAKDLTVFDAGGQLTKPSDNLLEWLEQQLNRTGDRLNSENQSARELLQLYFEEYLVGLPHEGLRRAEREGGLDEARRSFPFMRYVLERHDVGMDAYLRMHLSEEDYAFHQECGKPLRNDEPVN